ncbi:uncharacterized protein YbaA (DUF1428 family) [Hoeflea marina]|uniref:Uncharacterized protein YbaA (DUF1428 family) n=1 Tax=Hoeflea marina TaxID=274592 RepID=A0A317PQZ2_9HYPH|nr:DUF1428 domain-containing protein [Hoeflea marina]PWW03357.1 uncharacterized protein YbaA (DUF1428 family) [Hoeflea marina]
MAYVSAFIAPVATDRKQAYLELATMMAGVFKEYGASRIVESWGDKVPEGRLTSLPMAVLARPDETVVFSWVWWPDKETQKTGFDNALRDPRMQLDPAAMPFDMKRMIFGGFDVIVDE